MDQQACLSIDQIARRGYPAGRLELVRFFQQYVCASTPDEVLNHMREPELRRMVFIGVYNARYTSMTNRGAVINKAARALGLGRRNCFDYAKEFDATRKRAVK